MAETKRMASEKFSEATESSDAKTTLSEKFSEAQDESEKFSEINSESELSEESGSETDTLEKFSEESFSEAESEISEQKKKRKVFTVTDTLDYTEENTKLIRNILGHPGKINDVPLKECFCCMTMDKNHTPKYRSVKSMKSIQKIISYATPTDSVYMSFNSFVNRARHFDTNSAFQVHNICIDVDWHDSSPDEACAAANALAQELRCPYTRKSYGLPKPGAVCFTGRGAQIFFFLEHASFKMAFLAKKIAKNLCDKITKLLDDSPITYDGYSLDKAASERASGLCHMPGTINPKAGCFTQAMVFDTAHWNIVKLAEYVGIKYGEKRGETKQREKRSVPKEKTADMITIIETAAKSGDYMSREVLTHVCHAYMLSRGFGREAAEKEAWALNDMFPSPLPKNEIRALIRCDEAHNYRYGEKTIFEKTGISGKKEFFEKWPPKCTGGGNKARDERSAKARFAWHNEIRSLYAQGMTPSEVAKKTGRDIRTVKKYINTPMEELSEPKPEPKPEKPKDPDEDKKRAICLYKHGFREKAINKLMGIENAEELLAEYRKYRKLRNEKHYAMWRLSVIKKYAAQWLRRRINKTTWKLLFELDGDARDLSRRLYRTHPWDEKFPEMVAEAKSLNRMYYHVYDRISMYG